MGSFTRTFVVTVNDVKVGWVSTDGYGWRRSGSRKLYKTRKDAEEALLNESGGQR